jgi:hypothetical protein
MEALASCAMFREYRSQREWGWRVCKKGEGVERNLRWSAAGVQWPGMPGRGVFLSRSKKTFSGEEWGTRQEGQCRLSFRLGVLVIESSVALVRARGLWVIACLSAPRNKLSLPGPRKVCAARDTHLDPSVVCP